MIHETTQAWGTGRKALERTFACTLALYGATETTPLDALREYCPPDHVDDEIARAIYKATIDAHSQLEIPSGEMIEPVLLHTLMLDELEGDAAKMQQATAALVTVSVDAPMQQHLRHMSRKIRAHHDQGSLSFSLKSWGEDVEQSYLLTPEAVGVAIDDVTRDLERHRTESLDSDVIFDERSSDEIAENVGSDITPTGVWTSLETVDRSLLKKGGYNPGSFNVFGGRPGVGKTAWMIQSAVRAVRDGKRCLFITLEQPAAEIRQRMMSNVINKPILDANPIEKRQAAEYLPTDRLQIYMPKASPTVEHVSAVCSMFARRYGGLELVVIDYVQLMSGQGERRLEELSEITRSLKNMSRERDVVSLVGSQLKRLRDGERPTLKDLRESGTIEQDADTVILAWYRNGDDEEQGNLQIAMEKNRHGPTSQTVAFFRKEAGTFSARAGNVPPSEIGFEAHQGKPFEFDLG